MADKNGEYRADMTYNGAEFRRYLDEFKEFFDIKMDSAATDQIARIMRLILPVHRMQEVNHERVSFLPPVVQVPDEAGEGSDWGGDVLKL